MPFVFFPITIAICDSNSPLYFPRRREGRRRKKGKRRRERRIKISLKRSSRCPFECQRRAECMVRPFAALFVVLYLGFTGTLNWCELDQNKIIVKKSATKISVAVKYGPKSTQNLL